MNIQISPTGDVRIENLDKLALTAEEYAAFMGVAPKTVREKALKNDPFYPALPRKSDNEPVKINIVKACMQMAATPL